MLKYTFLTDKFYNDYKNCVEIEEKTDRPYIRIKICVDGVWWAIPMRSNIKHKYVPFTIHEYEVLSLYLSSKSIIIRTAANTNPNTISHIYLCKIPAALISKAATTTDTMLRLPIHTFASLLKFFQPPNST